MTRNNGIYSLEEQALGFMSQQAFTTNGLQTGLWKGGDRLNSLSKIGHFRVDTIPEITPAAHSKMPVSIIFYFYSLNSFLGKDTPIALVFNIFINTYAVIVFGIITADISGGSLSPTLSFSCFEIGNLSNSPPSTCMWGHFWQLNWASGTCGVDVVSLGNHCCLVGINQGQTLDKQLTADTRSNLKTMEANGREKKNRSNSAGLKETKYP